ncbi:MAG: fibronectin type III domain-containing protein [Bacteroidales bacterium]|jgi:hypothetical protein|nr:fibronectin type III domain-containing protein [Bacteroidales bacterium]
MKRKMLLLMLVLASFNWIIGQTSCYPDNVNYNTGSTNGTIFTKTSEIYTESNDAERGWARFNTSAIPDGDDISSVELHIYVNDDNYAYFNVMSMENDPLSGDAASVFIDAGDGTAYTTYTSNFPSPDWYVVDLGATASVDLKNRLADDWFAIGLYEHELSGMFYLSCDGWNEINKPYIVVTHATPPSCPAPSALSVSNIAANSADLSWTENGTATNWNIKWGASGFNPDTEGTIISSVTNPYTLSGLAADATYDWYVRSDCGGGDKSDWAGPNTFTIRDLAPTPYTQGFPTTTTPEGWTTTGWTIGTTGAIPPLDGNYIRSIMVSHIIPQSFTTINIGPVSADMVLSFYYAHANYQSPYASPGDGSGNFVVYLSTNYGQTYNTVLETVNNNTIATWQYKSYDLTAYAGENVKIKIKGNHNSGSYWLAFDNFSIAALPPCPAPTLLANSSITPNSADLSWTERGSATSWNIKWAAGGFDPATDGTLVSGVTNPYTLSGLDQNTTYHWYVQANCGGDEGDWAGPNTFTTLHLAPAPYTQGFPTTTTPEGWTTTYWTIGTETAIPPLDGNYIRRLMQSSTPQSFTTINIGPVSADMVLSFYYAHANYQSPYASPGDGSGNFVVYLSTNYGQTYNTVLETVNNNTIATWQYKSYDLTAYAGENVKIKIKGNHNSGSYWLAFDNFSIAALPPCPAPTLLANSSITPNSADLSWTERGSATSWNIKWAAGGFDPATDGTLVSGVTNPYTLSGLDQNTTYHWYVQANCGGDEGDWAGPNTFTTLHLAPAPYTQGFPTTTTPEGWTTTYWTIGTETAIPPLDGNYIRRLMQSSTPQSFTTINIGPVSADMVLSFYYAHANYQSPYASPGDGSGNFVVYLSTNYGQTYNTVLETVNNNTIATWQYKSYDLTAYAGENVKIKIKGNHNSGSYWLAFDNFSIAALPPCPAPTLLANSSITPNSADLSWTERGSATSWNIKMATANFDPDTEGTLIPGVNNPHSLSGLDPNTSYYWYVQADCGGGSVSDWEGPNTFTTLHLAPAPYTQGFPTTTTPEGWTTTYWTIGTTSAVPALEGNYIRGLMQNYTPQSFTTINIGPVSADMILSFYYVHLKYNSTSPPGNGTGNFVVSVSTDYGQSYTDLGSVDNNNTATWQYKSYDLTAYAGEYLKIKITGNRTSGDYWLAFDNFSIAVPLSCLDPITLTNSNITGVSVDLAWTEIGTATAWNIKWGASGFNPDTEGTMISGVSNPSTLAGLTQNTTYDWYVQADCGGSDESDWAGPKTFTTHSLSPTPYTQGFATTATPEGWTTTNWTIGPTTAIPAIDGNYIRGYIYNSSPKTFTTNNIGLVSAGMQLSFYYAHAITNSPYPSPGNNSGNFVVSVSTDYGQSYTDLETVDNNNTATWQYKSYDLAAYVGEYVKIKITGNRTSGSYYLAFDNFRVAVPIPCLVPTTLTNSNFTGVSADLGWTEIGTATAWNIKWGASGFNPGTEGTLVSGVSNPYTLAGLTQNTTYDWYVQADCGVGGESDWAGPKTFTTHSLSTTPYTQGFATTATPEGWTTTNWTIGTTTAIPAIDGNYIREYLYNAASKTFTTNNIGLVSAGMQLSFYYAHANYYSPYPAPGNNSGNFVVSVSTDYGQSYTDLGSVDNNSSAEWQYKSYDLAAFDGEYVKIKITGNRTSGDYYLAFDNFRVAIPIPCLVPTTLTESNITGVSADLGWTEIGTATNWNIKWGASGFNPGTEGTLVSGVSNPYTLAGLTQNTTYDWYVQADCGGDESDWAAPKTFSTHSLSPTPYTQGFATTTPPEGWSTTDWTIGTTEAIPAIDGNYIRGYFWAGASRILTTNNIGLVSAGMQLSFYYAHANYDPPYSPPGIGSGNFVVSVSTDYGQSYTDLETVNNNTSVEWQYKSYDLAAFDGEYVKIKITVNSTSVFYYLAFDNFSIAAPLSCLDPITLTNSNFTGVSADLGWTEIGTATSWNIKWGASGFNPGTEGTMISGVSNPYTLAGLTQNTTYDWYVQAACGVGGESDWAGPKTFTTHSLSTTPYTQGFATTTPPEGWLTTDWTIGTTEAIPAIDGNYIRGYLGPYYLSTTITTNNIGLVSAGMQLSFYYAHANYDPPYSPPGIGSGNFVVSVSTDYGQSYTELGTVSNNNTATWQYKFYDLTAYVGEYLKIKITGNRTSGRYWLAFDNFSVDVPPSCPAPTLLVNSNITVNSADLSWTESGSATTWNLEWKAGADFTPGNSESDGQITVNTNPEHSLAGLSVNTTYYWYVQADCGGGESDWVGPDSFTTTQLVATLPFSEDFETWPNSWTVVINGTQTNQWHVGTATAHGGSQAAYISNDAGTTNAYTLTESSVVHTYRDIAFTEGAQKFNLSFWWKGLGESSHDYMRIYVVETSYLPTAGVLPTSGQIGGNFNQTSEWTLAELELPGDYSGTTKRLVFSWRNDGSIGTPPPVAIDDITIRAISALSWTGATSHDWHDAQNWNPAFVPTANNNLTIPAGLTNYPTISSAASCNDIILQSNASGSASLLDNSLLTVNGNATIQRYIKGGGYHFVSVPINGTLTAGLFMNSYLYYFDADAATPAWTGVGSDPDIEIDNDQGYMIWYTGNNTTYNFNGSLISGDFTTATPSSGAAQFQYNLVPNPYPSPIDWDAGTGWTKTKLNNAIYIWNRAKATEANPNGQYASYISGASTNNGSQYIPMGQSFFVETAGSGAPALVMNNDVRVHSDQPFYKSNQQIPDLLRITSATENGNDEIVVRLHPDATPEFDREYDASKLFGSVSLPQLYSLTADERMLSINTIPLEDEPTVVPVGFEWPNKAEVNLKITELESFDPSINIFLEDLLSGEMIDVREQSVYSFIHDESYEALRFNLHFIKDAVTVGVDEQQLSAYQVWSYDSKVYVSIPALTGDKALIQLVDAQGKVVYEGEHHLSNPEIINVRTNQQLLIARIITGTQVYTQKVFIR